jgi:hypothetical protein
MASKKINPKEYHLQFKLQRYDFALKLSKIIRLIFSRYCQKIIPYAASINHVTRQCARGILW